MDEERFSEGLFVETCIGEGWFRGYARRDPEDPRKIRLDTIGYVEDEGYSRISIRLDQSDFERTRALSRPPRWKLRNGKVFEMPPAIWDENPVVEGEDEFA